MINHYYTIHKIVEELRKLIGCKLIECYSQEKNSIIFNFSDGINDFNLRFLNFKNTPVFYLNNKFSRAKSNTIDLFPDLINNPIQDIKIEENNRIVSIYFPEIILFFQIFSSSNSNIILTDNDCLIQDAFKKKSILFGKKFELNLPNLKSIDTFYESSSIYDVFSKSGLLLGKYYANELIHRLDLNPELKLSDFNEFNLMNIQNYAERIREECLNSKSTYLYKINSGFLLSLIELSYLKVEYEIFESVNDAIEKKLRTEYKQDNFTEIQNSILAKLTKNLKKDRKKLESLLDEKSVEERVKNYRKWAELLLMYPAFKSKKIDSIDVMDYDSNEITIKLEPKTTVMENANNFFKKAKNAENELKIRKKLIPDLENRVELNEKLISQIKETENKKELEKIMSEYKDELDINLGNHNSNDSKFREFDLGDGFILYVGKNAANNDELTMKFAKPHDMWFHARGAGGSHAVLRLNKDQKAPKYILKKAAAIVAYYSQARKGKYVPVAYTFKKYVRKPKGSNVGTVVLSREEVIMIEPGLPNNN